MLWKLFTGQTVPRISGLKYVKRLLEHESVGQPSAVLWVVAREVSREKLLAFLQSTERRGLSGVGYGLNFPQASRFLKRTSMSRRNTAGRSATKRSSRSPGATGRGTLWSRWEEERRTSSAAISSNNSIIGRRFIASALRSDFSPAIRRVSQTGPTNITSGGSAARLPSQRCLFLVSGARGNYRG